MADRKSEKWSRAPAGSQNGQHSIAAPGRARAAAAARVSDQSELLVGEGFQRATDEHAAHCIAVYTELLSFNGEPVEITAKRRLSMSEDARGEAADDDAVLTAQADKYTRRLGKWRAQVILLGAVVNQMRMSPPSAVPDTQDGVVEKVGTHAAVQHVGRDRAGVS